MNIQIFGTKKCKDTQKAIRFFKERGLKIHFIDLKEKNLSKGELKSIARFISLEDLIDKDGSEYKKNNLEYIMHDIEEVLLENSLLCKTPIVRSSGKAIIGYLPEKWKEIINDQK